jgi:hypothetical protein
VISEICKLLFDTASGKSGIISGMAGRPKTMDTRKIVSLPIELAKAIEDYRFNNRLKTEAEAIRRLIEKGLKAENKVPTRVRKPPNIAPSTEGKPISARKGRASQAHKQSPN